MAHSALSPTRAAQPRLRDQLDRLARIVRVNRGRAALRTMSDSRLALLDIDPEAARREAARPFWDVA